MYEAYRTRQLNGIRFAERCCSACQGRTRAQSGFPSRPINDKRTEANTGDSLIQPIGPRTALIRELEGAVMRQRVRHEAVFGPEHPPAAAVYHFADAMMLGGFKHVQGTHNVDQSTRERRLAAIGG